MTGIRIEEAAEHVRIFFEAQPPAKLRYDLKLAGFRWKPRLRAWQRKRTAAAGEAIGRLLGATYPTPAKFAKLPSNDSVSVYEGAK